MGLRTISRVGPLILIFTVILCVYFNYYDKNNNSKSDRSSFLFSKSSIAENLQNRYFQNYNKYKNDNDNANDNYSLIQANCYLNQYRPNHNNQGPFKCYYDLQEKQFYLPYNNFIRKYSDISEIKNIESQLGLSSSSTSKNFQQSSNKIKILPNITINYSYSDPNRFILSEDFSYSLASPFLNFGSFQVERRSRVKCQDPLYNLPVTTQWDKKGYFYTTQIAQFGLSYFSRYFDSVEKIQREEAEKDLEINRRKKRESENENENNFHISPSGAITTTIYNLTSSTQQLYPKLHFKFSENYKTTIFSFSQKHPKIDCKSENLQPTVIFMKFTTSNSQITILLKYVLKTCIFEKRQDLLRESVDSENGGFTYFEKYPLKSMCESQVQVRQSSSEESEGGNNDKQQLELAIILYGEDVHHRNPNNDIQKYLKDAQDKNKNYWSKFKNINPNSIELTQIEYISSTSKNNQPTTIQISSKADLQYFWQSVSYLSKSYDGIGGFPMPVARILPGYEKLEPGWYGAMAQGHALSVFSRAYYLTKNPKYFDDILNVLQPFKIKSEDGGIKNYVFGEFTWYEEYPMLPDGQFVLNGFMYSLVGLFDAYLACSPTADEYESVEFEGSISKSKEKRLKLDDNVIAISCHHTVKVLLNEGLTSLHKLLPLYDNGFGSNYDLRHVVNTDANPAPNRARWDYHFIHVTLLRLLSNIFHDQSKLDLLLDLNFDHSQITEMGQRFSVMEQRWLGYMDGAFAENNGNN